MADPEEERRREAFKAYLEVYKHMATLSTAAAVVLVALYRDVGVEARVTVIALACLGISLASSVYAMVYCATQIGHGPENRLRREKPQEGIYATLFSFGSFTLFLSGLVLYAMVALGWLGG